MIESNRMILRKIVPEDRAELAVFLQDDEVMYAWNGGFGEEVLDEWISKNIKRYTDNGAGFLLAQDRQTGETIGAIGPIFSKDINGKPGWEVGYILKKQSWGKGYAKEGAAACINFCFDNMKAKQVIVQMRTQNEASEKVAKALGLCYECEYNREYLGESMPHRVYVAKGRVDE